ncbi:hypothetical protein BC567DRAFT_237357 [Phyllosticta citribraziliensis]
MSVFCAWRFLGLFQLAAHDAARAAQKQTKRDVESRRRTDGQAGGRTDGCSPATATATATGAPQGNVTQRNPARLRTPPTHRTRPELFWWVLRPAAAAGASVHGRCKSVVSFTAAAGECCFFFADLLLTGSRAGLGAVYLNVQFEIITLVESKAGRKDGVEGRRGRSGVFWSRIVQGAGWSSRPSKGYVPSLIAVAGEIRNGDGKERGEGERDCPTDCCMVK